MKDYTTLRKELAAHIEKVFEQFNIIADNDGCEAIIRDSSKQANFHLNLMASGIAKFVKEQKIPHEQTVELMEIHFDLMSTQRVLLMRDVTKPFANTTGHYKVIDLNETFHNSFDKLISMEAESIKVEAESELIELAFSGTNHAVEPDGEHKSIPDGMGFIEAVDEFFEAEKRRTSQIKTCKRRRKRNAPLESATVGSEDKKAYIMQEELPPIGSDEVHEHNRTLQPNKR